MENLEIKLLDMLKMNKSMYEINKELGTSNDDIYKMLFDIKSKYSEFKSIINKGNIQYTNFYDLFKNDNTYINMDSDNDKIRIMLISDLHLCHQNESLKAVNAMYDYVVKNNIKLIFNLGDFIEGYNSNKQCKFDNYKRQTRYALFNYPSDKSVTNFLLLGNHDISLLLNKNIDVARIIARERDDIVVTGIGASNVYLNNFRFRFRHEISDYPVNHLLSFNNGIIFKGHSHRYKVTSRGPVVNIYIPNLSDVKTNNTCCPFPSMVDMTLHFNFKSSHIDNVALKRYIYYSHNFILMDEQIINVNILDNDIYMDKCNDDNLNKVKSLKLDV